MSDDDVKTDDLPKEEVGLGGVALTINYGSAAYFETVRKSAGLSIDDYPDERVRTVLKMAVPAEATLSQAAAFLSICRSYKLDPLVGQVWLAIVDGKPTVLTGRDTFITVAERRPTYAGIAVGTVMEGESCTIWRDPDDPYSVKIDHRQGFEAGKQIVGWYCVAFDRERPPIIVRRMRADYEYLMANTRRRVWQLDPKGMGENRVIAAALRRMYSLAGLMMDGEEGDLERAASPAPAQTALQKQAADLRSHLASAAARNGIEVAQNWSEALVITEGKHKGKVWGEVLMSDPVYARKVATRRQLGLTRADAEAVHAALDRLREPATPLESVGRTQDALDELYERAKSLLTQMTERGRECFEDFETLGLYYNDRNEDGLRKHVAYLEDLASA